MESNSKLKLLGNLACLGAYTIFGFNLISCKTIAIDGNVSPMALFLLRSIGALILFWISSLFMDKGSKIEKKDFWKIACASFLGMFMTQYSFLVAITMTTPIDASIMQSIAPVLTMLIAAIAIKEKISVHGITGVMLSLCGVLFIITNTVRSGGGVNHTSSGGIFFMLLNALSFSLYIGIFKPLIQKYPVVTFMKWMFLFSTLMALPFGIGDLIHTNYAAIPVDIWVHIAYVIIGATFVSYFLIPFGQKHVSPAVVCMYSYVQPVIAMGISLVIGLDSLTFPKIMATVCIFVGVGIANFSPKRLRRHKTNQNVL